MKVSVELSLYPLNADYIPAIKAFIDALEHESGLTVVRNTMSTQVFGDADAVFDALKRLVQQSWAAYGKGAFVMKVLPGDLSP